MRAALVLLFLTCGACAPDRMWAWSVATACVRQSMLPNRGFYTDWPMVLYQEGTDEFLRGDPGVGLRYPDLYEEPWPEGEFRAGFNTRLHPVPEEERDRYRLLPGPAGVAADGRAGDWERCMGLPAEGPQVYDQEMQVGGLPPLSDGGAWDSRDFRFGFVGGTMALTYPATLYTEATTVLLRDPGDGLYIQTKIAVENAGLGQVPEMGPHEHVISVVRWKRLPGDVLAVRGAGFSLECAVTDAPRTFDPLWWGDSYKDAWLPADAPALPVYACVERQDGAERAIMMAISFRYERGRRSTYPE